MEFKLEFGTGNDAFGRRGSPYYDIARARECREILEDVKRALIEGATSGRVRDANGNTVGKWSLEEEEE